ncbi:MAG: ATP synthase F1 subunit gamma [Pontiellaceae bacterium]|nr:ATP synthase F1 subunit gamma [Pontiellaceae bacterium]MBN2783196.1 ATP synthase F1 subunit gamma [Pontiellaceae bacterium]
MANLRDIRQRIKAIRSMAKITKAMQMVAISKMKRAQDAATCGIPYADMLSDILAQVTRHIGTYEHGLMETREGGLKMVILVSTDRGLCGSLNTNVFREVAKYDRETTLFITIGAKAAKFIQRTGRELIVDFDYGDPPLLSEARMVCRFVAQLFLDEEINSAEIIFSDYISTFKQEPLTWHFLPVGQTQESFDRMPDSLKRTKMEEQEKGIKGIAEFEFEPNVNTVYESLLLRSLDYQLLQIMREVRASEHSARMVSMKQATDNAEDMDGKLQLIHNNLRQAAITNELLELNSAAD